MKKNKLKKLAKTIVSTSAIGAAGMIISNSVAAGPEDQPETSTAKQAETSTVRQAEAISAEKIHQDVANQPAFQQPFERDNLVETADHELINQFRENFWNYIQNGKNPAMDAFLEYTGMAVLGEDPDDGDPEQDFRGLNQKWGLNITEADLTEMFNKALQKGYDFANRIQHKSVNYGYSNEEQKRISQQQAFDVANTVIVQLADKLIKQIGLDDEQAIKNVFDEITFFRFLIQKVMNPLNTENNQFRQVNYERVDPINPTTEQQQQYLQAFLDENGEDYKNMNGKTAVVVGAYNTNPNHYEGGVTDSSSKVSGLFKPKETITWPYRGKFISGKTFRMLRECTFTDYDNISRFYRNYIANQIKFNEQDQQNAKRQVLQTFYNLVNSNIYLRGQGTTSTIFARALMYSAGFHVKNVGAWHINSPLFIPVFEALINCGPGMMESFIENNLDSIKLVPVATTEEATD